MKYHRNAIRLVANSLLTVGVTILPCCAGTVTGLGSATNYGLFALPGTSVTMNAFTLNGNVGLAQGVTFKGANPNLISGSVYESASGQFDNTGTHGSVLVQPATLSQNVIDANAAYTADIALTPTQTLGAISSATSITGNGGLNVIDINGNITSGLTLSGNANNTFIVIVDGNMHLTTGNLGVSGGLSASNVLYIFDDGTTANPGTIDTMVPDKLYGTILAPNYNINMDSDLNGELIGGGSGDEITLMSVQNITANPFTPPSSVPEPGTYSIAALGLVVLSGLGRFVRRTSGTEPRT